MLKSLQNTAMRKIFLFVVQVAQISVYRPAYIAAIDRGNMKTQSLLFYAIFLLFAFTANGLRVKRRTTYENEERISDEGNPVMLTIVSVANN